MRLPETQQQQGQDTLLVNANVLTMYPAHPSAQAVALSGDRIVAVGENVDLRRLATAKTKLVDCQGLTLLPGFNDAHCHLLALARTFRDLDCRPENVNSVSTLQDLVRSAARKLRPGEWVRGFGYDELAFTRGQHPTRWDLDQAAPDHPVRLDHRSGHATVLNSLALELAGVHSETPDPVEGVIQRAADTAEPTGVLLEMAGFLRQRLGNSRSEADLKSGVSSAARRLLSYGVTSIQDAGADNGIEKWTRLQQLQCPAVSTPRITMFAGAQRLDEFLATRMRWGHGDHHLRLGHAKIMLTVTTGTLSPSRDELWQLVQTAHQAGFPVAVHCIEQEAVRVTAEVLGEQRFSGFIDRIEHCAECPPELVDLVGRCGAAVVTQPGFIYWNGPSYRDRVSEDLKAHLYRAGALHRAGVAVAFGSDAPVIDPNPWPGIYSAATRLGCDGHPLGDDETSQTIDLESALRMYTLAGALAEGASTHKGSITRGKLADLVLVDTDPLAVDLNRIKNIRAVLTVVGGRTVFEDGRCGDSS